MIACQASYWACRCALMSGRVAKEPPKDCWSSDGARNVSRGSSWRTYPGPRSVHCNWRASSLGRGLVWNEIHQAKECLKRLGHELLLRHVGLNEQVGSQLGPHT